MRGIATTQPADCNHSTIPAALNSWLFTILGIQAGGEDEAIALTHHRPPSAFALPPSRCFLLPLCISCGLSPCLSSLFLSALRALRKPSSPASERLLAGDAPSFAVWNSTLVFITVKVICIPGFLLIRPRSSLLVCRRSLCLLRLSSSLDACTLPAKSCLGSGTGSDAAEAAPEPDLPPGVAHLLAPRALRIPNVFVAPPRESRAEEELCRPTTLPLLRAASLPILLSLAFQSLPSWPTRPLRFSTSLVS